MSKKLTKDDLCRASKRLVTSTAEVQTFLAVETKDAGFDDRGRVVILFERHHFHRLTGGRFDANHPDISNRDPGGYNQGGSQHERFSKAFALDPHAAMMSTSWGIGQVMGFNHAICGYRTVADFVDAMKISEGKQLDASVEFIVHNGLDDDLRRHDWAGFARGYNGVNYKKNSYDKKLASWFKKFEDKKIDCSKVSAEPAEDPTNVDTDTAEKDDQTTAENPNSKPVTGQAQPTLPQPPIILPPIVPVPQAKPAEDIKPDRWIDKIKAIYLAAPAMIATFLTGVGTWLQGARIEITLGFFGASALIGMTWISWAFWIKNQREKRDTDLKKQREAQAFELTKLQMQSAMRPDLQTVQLVPPVVESSDQAAEEK